MPELPHVAHGAWVRKRPKPKPKSKNLGRRPVTVTFVSPVQEQIRKWQSLGSGNISISRTQLRNETAEPDQADLAGDLQDAVQILQPGQPRTTPTKQRPIVRGKLPGQSQRWRIWGDVDDIIASAHVANDGDLEVSKQLFATYDFDEDTSSSSSDGSSLSEDEPGNVAGSRQINGTLEPLAIIHDGVGKGSEGNAFASKVLFLSDKPTIESWLSRTKNPQETTGTMSRLSMHDRGLYQESVFPAPSEVSTCYASTQRPRSVIYYPSGGKARREVAYLDRTSGVQPNSSDRRSSRERLHSHQSKKHEHNPCSASVQSDSPINDILKDHLKDELQYRVNLQVLTTTVIPQLIKESLSKSKHSSVAVDTARLSAQPPAVLIRQLLHVTASIEKLNSIHQQIPRIDIFEFTDWALLAAKAYADYIDHWFYYRQPVGSSFPEREKVSVRSEGAPRTFRQEDESQQSVSDINDLLQQPFKRLQAIKRILKSTNRVVESDRSEQACLLFSEMTRKAKERVSNERSHYEDSLAIAVELGQVLDPRTLLPFSDAVIDSRIQVFAKDDFAFSMSHSSGKLIDCQVEVILRTLSGDNHSNGDLLIVVNDEAPRPWLLFPPLPLKRITYGLVDEMTLALVVAGSSSGSVPWQEDFKLVSDLDRITDWLRIMDEHPAMQLATNDAHEIRSLSSTISDEIARNMPQPILVQEAGISEAPRSLDLKLPSCNDIRPESAKQYPRSDVLFTLLHWQHDDGWIPLVQDLCSILVQPGSLEFVLYKHIILGAMQPSTPRALVLDLRTISSVRRPTALDISLVRAADNVNDRAAKYGNLLLRARSVADCETLYAAINGALVASAQPNISDTAVPQANEVFPLEPTPQIAPKPGWLGKMARVARSTNRSLPTQTSDRSHAGLTAASRVLSIFKTKTDRTHDKPGSPSAPPSADSLPKLDDPARSDWLAIIDKLHPLGPTNLDVKLFTKQTAQNWGYSASGRLVILKAHDRFSCLDGLPHRRLILFSKQKNDILLDCRVRQDGFERSGRVGIVAKIWEPLQGSIIPGDGGVIGGSLTQFMIQLRGEAEAAYTFSVLTAVTN